MKIADILTPERVVLDAALETKQAVLEALAGLLAQANPALNESAILDSLLARERLGTTGLGAGIAIPHGRAAQAAGAIGAFVRTRRPVAYAAIDKAPVDLFFALCVPAGAAAEHLALLAELAKLFNVPRLVQALRHSASAPETYALLIAPAPAA